MNFISYLLTLISLLVLDGIWVGFVAKKFYAEQIGFLYRANVLWVPIILFYLIYAFAITYFAISPSTTKAEVLIRALILGFTAYMTYDLVNYATIANFPLKMVLVDLSWGTIMTAGAAFIGFLFI
jgi:uncharacterized membrane protein